MHLNEDAAKAPNVNRHAITDAQHYLRAAKSVKGVSVMHNFSSVRKFLAFPFSPPIEAALDVAVHLLVALAAAPEVDDLDGRPPGAP